VQCFPPKTIQLKTKTKIQPFNPNSRQQIAGWLLGKGWEPERFTDTGQPKVDEAVLKTLDYPEVQLLLHYQMIDKRLSQINDWLTRAEVSGGRLHGSMNTCGAVTARATHSQPNLSAVPRVLTGKDEDGNKVIRMGFDGRYGAESRSLWIASKGLVLVGADASGLQLRMLANHLARWDGGRFAEVILSGDIHDYLQQCGGLPQRDQSKSAIYCLLFGGGDTKLGRTIARHGSLTAEQRTQYNHSPEAAVGRKYRTRLRKEVHGLEPLMRSIERSVESSGGVRLLDGRLAPIRKTHATLNTLLMGDEAVLMKSAMWILHSKSKDIPDAHQLLWSHDEFQWECRPEDAETLGELMVASIQEAGQRLRCRLPIDGEYKIGNNWAETH
jgi:DNA polymerase I-like protein with 3'-5' exonuclease and polymerase domains